MGTHAAHKLAAVARNTRDVLAIEALCAAQGIDFRAPLRAGAGVAAAHAAIRAQVAHLDADRPPSPDIDAVRELVHTGDLLANGATQRAHA